MKTTDYERITEVKNFLKFKSWTEFQQALGLKNSQIFTDLKKPNRRITANLASSITNHFPSINYEWLMTGNGTMTIENINAPAIIQTGNGNTGDIHSNCDKLINTIEKLTAQNGELITIIANLTKRQ